MKHSATYSPDDNKCRLYPAHRLDADEYARVKAAGFRWAPKQELFVAPMWTPAREDLLLELCGEIDDEDKSLVERAEERSERFEDYSDKRMADANYARKAVDAIADNIPLGQPILIGHHSERHARRDAKKIENGMRKAVKMWQTSKYWTARAEGAIRHAKYKESPGVRHRRIKGLESEKRKQEKRLPELRLRQTKWLREDITAEQVGAALRNGYDFDLQKAFEAGTITAQEIIERWRNGYVSAIAHTERWIAHYENRLAYERAMLAEQLGADTTTPNAMEARFDLKPGGKVLIGRDGWLVILRVNKTQGAVSSVTTVAPPYVTWTGQWKYGIEKIQDYQPPTEELAAKVKKATSLPPLCNYPGEGFREITEAEWNARRKWSDFPYIKAVGTTETVGRHRYRQMPHRTKQWSGEQVYITDMKRVDPPAPAPKPDLPRSEPVPMTGYAAPQPKHNEPGDAEFRALQDSLKAGVTVVMAPQLFPTPLEIAEQVIDMAEIRTGMTVLEPSAGLGGLAVAASRQQAVVTCVEISASLATQLRELDKRGPYFYEVRNADFLECNGDLGTFDRIVMNPPFERGADITHIKHAMTFLKPGGRLVAICANGPRQREKLKPLASEWIDLPAGSFKGQGTGVHTAMLVIDKAS